MRAAASALINLAVFVNASALTPTAMAADVCAEILSQGVYDRWETTTFSYRYSSAKAVACEDREKSVNLTIPVEGNPISFGEKEVKDLCQSSESTAKASNAVRKTVQRVNSAIVDAWAECARSKRRGVEHAIFPSVDPSRFVYRVGYDADGEPYSTIVRPNMTGQKSCKPTLPENLSIDDGKLAFFTCARAEPEKTTVTVTLSADSGGGHLRPIELSPYDPVPPLVSVRECLAQGTPAKVVFKNCGRVDLGTIQCGFNYIIQYNRNTKQWSMTGYNLGSKSVGTWVYKLDLASNQLSAWGSRHEVADDGLLTKGKTDEKIDTGRVYCTALAR